VFSEVCGTLRNELIKGKQPPATCFHVPALRDTFTLLGKPLTFGLGVGQSPNWVNTFNARQFWKLFAPFPSNPNNWFVVVGVTVPAKMWTNGTFPDASNVESEIHQIILFDNDEDYTGSDLIYWNSQRAWDWNSTENPMHKQPYVSCKNNAQRMRKMYEFRSGSRIKDESQAQVERNFLCNGFNNRNSKRKLAGFKLIKASKKIDGEKHVVHPTQFSVIYQSWCHEKAQKLVVNSTFIHPVVPA